MAYDSLRSLSLVRGAIAIFIFDALTLLTLNNNFAFKHFSWMKQRKVKVLTPLLEAQEAAPGEAALIENA